MAELAVPGARPATWLDRPLLPSRERLSAIAAHWEVWAYGAIVLIGFVLRVWDVGGRAMHHDESLHAYFSWKFFAGQGYAYDPLMHGPLQFEVVPLFYLLFGDNEGSARLFAVVCGTIVIALPYLLRGHLTRTGALLAALMLAISPAFVYYSRFIRDDMYLACFTLIMFIAIVKYLDRPRPYLLYVLAAAAALAMASMEAAYLNFLILGSFVGVQALSELVGSRDGPVLRAFRATTLDTLLTGVSIFVVITVVCYSSFFTNPYGIWDTKHSFFLPGQAWTLHGLNPARRDILGGLFYWKAQHTVERGNEPTFYYLLLLPLYEQLALVFGVAGIAWAAFRRSLVSSFLVWWAVMSFGLYSWAGEKMPWLVIHIALPLILLAGWFLGRVLASGRRILTACVAAAALLFATLEIHSTFLLNYVDAANPTEMLIYVQSSQDVPNTVNELAALSRRTTGNLGMSIGLDTNDVGGWPFIWYLRHFTNVTETSTFSGPVCGGQNCSALLMLQPEFDQSWPQLSHEYVAQKYRWNWWFPQDYMTWFSQNMGGPFDGKVAPITGIGGPTDWKHVWDWMMYRRRFADPNGLGARWLYVLIRRDLVPDAKAYTSPPVATQSLPTPALRLSALPVRWLGSVHTSAAGHPLASPHGLAPDGHGGLYVADTLNHRIVHYGPTGQVLGVIGGPGDGPGQFALRDSPQGVAVGRDGNVYVADTWHQRISVFTPGGKLLRQWGGGAIGSAPGQFFGPRSVAVGADGRVYVADTGNKRIQVFSSHGTFLRSWGTAGTGQGSFQEPSSVALGRGNLVYVADFWNQRVQVFSSIGAYVRSWPVPGWAFGSYDEPYIAVDAGSGDILVSVPAQSTALLYWPSGRLVGQVQSNHLSLPIGVAALGHGRFAVGDETANRVSLFSTVMSTSAPSR